MPITITPVYAGLLTLLYVFLSFRVINARRSGRIGLGDGGDPVLLRRLRAHANFAEYVPLALVLMALLELRGAPGWQVHLVGGLVAAGRVCHAVGFGRENEIMRLRVAGMVLTISGLVTAALANLGVSGILAILMRP